MGSRSLKSDLQGVPIPEPIDVVWFGEAHIRGEIVPAKIHRTSQGLGLILLYPGRRSFAASKKNPALIHALTPEPPVALLKSLIKRGVLVRREKS